MEINNSKNPNLSFVYEAKNGAKFYSLVDPFTISALRGISAEKAKRFLDMNITERSLKELIKECKKAAGENDIVKAFSIIQEIEYRLNFISEESSILDLVCIYFFLEDEDPEIASEAFNKRKHAIFEADPQCRSFFLQIGIVICKKFSPKQEESMFDYLAENQVTSQRILRYIAAESLIPLTNG
jgi:hypothetical protein